MGDVSAPLFGNRIRSKARASLAKAVELAPKDQLYRRELFNFLVWTDTSRTALDEAAKMLQAMSESDPQYATMKWQLSQERAFRSSAGNRVAEVFLLPTHVIQIVDRPIQR